MKRCDGRSANDLRPVKITRNYIKHAEGSVLIELGDTKVICNATVEEKIPGWMKGSGKGWVSAEYSMLPRATPVRNVRESAKGKISGRTYEIQRLVGRSLRSVVHMEALGERTVWLDCDVIQADGGTRTASITGAFVALVDAMNHLIEKGVIKKMPITDFMAAVSVGKVRGKVFLDLCFEEDCGAEVDMNIVMTGAGAYVEVQGTAEGPPFSRTDLNRLLRSASIGIDKLIDVQKEALGELAEKVGESVGKNSAGNRE